MPPPVRPASHYTSCVPLPRICKQDRGVFSDIEGHPVAHPLLQNIADEKGLIYIVQILIDKFFIIIIPDSDFLHALLPAPLILPSDSLSYNSVIILHAFGVYSNCKKIFCQFFVRILL